MTKRRRSKWGSVEQRAGGWDMRWRDPETGKPKRKRAVGARNKTEAKAALAELRRRVLGQWGGGATLREFLGTYRDAYRASTAASTFRQTWSLYERVADWFGATPLERIDLIRAEEFLAFVSGNGFGGRKAGPMTVRGYVSKLAFLWKQMPARGMRVDNPWLQVRRPRVRVRPIDAQTGTDVDRILAITPDDLRDWVSVLAETGLRCGEAARLQWGDVGDRLLVRESKSGRPRQFGLSGRARAVLDRVRKRRTVPLRGEDRVFADLPRYGTDAWARWNSAALYRWQRALKRHGFPRLRFHDLRHSLGYRMASAGCTELEIARVLGHASLQTTRRYMDHHPEATADRAIARLDAHEDSDSVTQPRASNSRR